MGTITALEIQKRNKERVNVYLDNTYAFSITLLQAAQLRRGQVLTPADIAALQAEDDVAKAVDVAARYLSYRPRSTEEVRRNLAEKDLEEPVIASALERLTHRGYLDDAAFARWWVENRLAFKPLGERALRHELRQKGVSEAHITQALAALPADEPAYQAAQTRLKRWRGTDRRTFQAKLSAFLQRRGFTHETTREVLDRVLAELDETDPDYFAGDAPPE